MSGRALSLSLLNCAAGLARPRFGLVEPAGPLHCDQDAGRGGLWRLPLARRRDAAELVDRFAEVAKAERLLPELVGIAARLRNVALRVSRRKEALAWSLALGSRRRNGEPHRQRESRDRLAHSDLLGRSNAMIAVTDPARKCRFPTVCRPPA